ncbi:MAG: HlyD family efflux transporter periplasmic adaptor subunit [Polyangiaceae bacterium]
MDRLKNSASILVVCLIVGGCQERLPTPDGFQGLVEFDARTLSFDANGRVEAVAVNRGDLVHADQVLAQLDDTIPRLSCVVRQQELSSARADLALVEAGTRAEDIAALAAGLRGAQTSEALFQTTANRAQALFEQNALPRADLDKAQADLRRASFERQSIAQRLAALRHGARPEEVARAQARVDVAAAQLALEEELRARQALRAIANGEVLDILVKPGELAGVGTPAFVVADTQHPYVDVFVPQADLDGIRPGRPAQLRVDATSKVASGRVEFVSPEMEFTPKFLFSDRERPHLVVRVRVRVDDSERRLHAGVPAFVRVER